MHDTWSSWRRYFEHNAERPLPAVTDGLPDAPELRRALARSFAIFQLGEAGEGRIVREVVRFAPSTIDEDWRASIGHWVREEGRHGRLLGDAARALGGKPVRENWTHDLLVVGRRLLGLRLKLLVILTAEVVGISFYGMIAAALPRGGLRRALELICAEEVKHLHFHARFFRLETRSLARRALFLLAWWLVGTAAGLVVIVDHQRTLGLLGIGRATAARRFAALLAETARMTRAGAMSWSEAR